MTLRDLLQDALTTVSRRHAEALALHVLCRNRAWLHAHPQAVITGEQADAIRTLLERRVRSEPLQYITGHQEFFGLDLLVTPAVLIPRPETEHLVETVLDWAKETTGELRVLDVGTGSGAIALALAAHLPRARVTALDISEAALLVARHNAARLGLSDRVRFLQSDLLDALAPELAAGLRFDVLASNPPYVASAEAAELATEVRDFEPGLALFAGTNGMAIFERLLPAAAQALRPGGLLAMEFGYGQRDLMHRLFQAQPIGVWSEWNFIPDLQGIPRVVRAVRGSGICE